MTNNTVDPAALASQHRSLPRPATTLHRSPTLDLGLGLGGGDRCLGRQAQPVRPRLDLDRGFAVPPADADRLA